MIERVNHLKREIANEQKIADRTAELMGYSKRDFEHYQRSYFSQQRYLDRLKADLEAAGKEEIDAVSKNI